MAHMSRTGCDAGNLFYHSFLDDETGRRRRGHTFGVAISRGKWNVS